MALAVEPGTGRVGFLQASRLPGIFWDSTVTEPYIATVFSQSLNNQTAVVVSEYRVVVSQYRQE